MQMGRQGVRANCIAPGLVLSDRVQQWIDEATGIDTSLTRTG